MPGNDYLPNAWLGTQQLIEHFSGTTLLVLNAVDVDAPADWTAFSDIRMLINGRGGFGSNAFSMSTLINAAATAAGAPGLWSMSLTADDRVAIKCTVAFDVLASGPQWGVPVGTLISSALEDGLQTVTASKEWVRGPFTEADALFVLSDPSPGFAWTFTPAMADGTYDSVPQVLYATLLVGGTDVEARPTDNFGQLCVTALGSADAARLALTAEGKVLLAIDNTYANPLLTTDFMQWLGFTGAEAFVRVAGSGVAMKEAVATNLPAGLTPLHRPVRLDPQVYTETSAVIMSDGYVDRSHVYTLVGHNVTFVPMGRAAVTPTAAQLLRGFYATLWKSAFFTVWQNSKETRTAIAESEDYTGHDTGEWDAGVGTVRLVVHPDYTGQLLALQNERSTKLYAPVTIQALPYIRKE